jgi:ATP-dependent DNA helicase UvrD/PcrA
VASALRQDVLERTGLRAALAYLRIAVAPPGQIAAADIVEILRRPSRGLPQWFPDRIRRRSWWGMDQLWSLVGTVPDKEAVRVERLVDDLAAVVAAGAADTGSILAVIKDGIGLGGAMGLLDGSKGDEGSSHLDDLDALEQVAGLHPTPATFEPWLRETLARPRSEGGVTLSTIHRVKGMEWGKVVVFGVNAGIIPHRLADDEEEERRVLHVALTRCKDEVVLLVDRDRPSPMLAELDGTAPARSSTSPQVAAPLRPAPRGQAPRGDLRPEDQKVEAALRAWRLARCRRDKVSAFIVLYDRTLRTIAAEHPTSLLQLSRIEGIGPTKLELYGDEILAVLADLDN